MRAQTAGSVEELRGLTFDHPIVVGQIHGRLRLEGEIERLTLAHHGVRFVQERQHLQDAPGIEMRRRLLEAQEAQRAHRVAGVDRPRHAVRAPQGRPSVAQLVAVLDVVVDERIVVEDLDGHRGVERLLDRRAFADGDA